METPSPLIELAFSSILALTLAMARVYPCLLLLPLFNLRDIKGLLRYAIVLTVSLVIAPGIGPSLTGMSASGPELIFLFFKEAVIGALLGILLGLPFWLFESVGAMLDNQRGALIGGQLNPSLGPDATPIGHMLKQLLIFLMIISGGFFAVLQVIWDSYLLWPPTLWFPQPAAEGLEVYLGLLSKTFQHIVLYAAPMVAVLLFIDFSLAIISLFSPHMQVFILAMPAKSLLGIAFLILYLPMLVYLAENQVGEMMVFKHTLALLFSR